jgi:phenylacetate-CoA ligase
MADQILTNIWGTYLEKTFLRKSYLWSAGSISNYQIRHLNEILASAKKLKGYSCLRAIENLRNLSELTRVPVLAKQTIKNSPSDFVDLKSNWLVEDHTSGSTGNPLTIYLTQKQKALEFAYVLRFYRRFGYRLGDRMVAFRSYIPSSDDALKWNFVKRRNELLFSVYHMTPENLRQYIQEFNSFRPKFVRGYPTSIYIVALFAVQHQLELHPPQAVFCSSEVLTEEQKKIIEKAFGAPAVNWYGSNERAITASQCQYLKNLHVHEEAGILEVINEEGTSSLEDSAIVEGEIVVTGLINSAMPLIRYKLGDVGIISKDPCKCGFNGLSLVQIKGRADDIIVTSKGKSVPPVRFYTLFEKHPNVNMFQIVQQSDQEIIDVNLVTSGKIDHSKLLTELTYFLGEGNIITLHFVDDITPEKSGKRKHIKVIKRDG